MKDTEVALVPKITIKALGCTPAKVAALPDKQKLPLCHILGKAQEVRYQEDKSNAGNVHIFFVGNFEGVNLETGEVFRSGKLFLPRGISEVVEVAIKESQKEDKNASVSFAFEVRSVKATNPIGYSYEAAALKRPEKEDELAELRKLLPVAKAEQRKSA